MCRVLWTFPSQEVYSREKVEEGLAQRDANDYTSDTIQSWACATREILSRVVEGFYAKVGVEENCGACVEDDFQNRVIFRL